MRVGVETFVQVAWVRQFRKSVPCSAMRRTEGEVGREYPYTSRWSARGVSAQITTTPRRVPRWRTTGEPQKPRRPGCSEESEKKRATLGDAGATSGMGTDSQR